MMRSESTSAFGHPRLTNPTFGWRRLMRARDCTGGRRDFPQENPSAEASALTLQMPRLPRRAEADMGAQVAEKRPLGAMGRMGVVVALHVGALFVIGQGLMTET